MAEWIGGGRIVLTINLLLISFPLLGYYCLAVSDSDHPCDRDWFFGRNCHFTCNCKDNGICDKVTGKCSNGCSGDLWGDQCLLSSSCSYNDGETCSVLGGTCTGMSYVGKKSQSISGACEDWNDFRGRYPDSDFTHLDGSSTAAKNYCRNPRKDDAKKPWCYISNNANWNHCDVNLCDCPQYRYGKNCQDECLCYDVEETCDGTSGACRRSGCLKGIGGTDCKADCSDGKCGINCDYTCNCMGNAVCDKTTGLCPSGCDYGWSGEACQIGNGAFMKNAQQSSRYESFVANRAVDNDTNPDMSGGQSCSHTNRENNPWWRVDLLHRHVLFNLTIFNRDCSDCGEIRLKKIKIWMTDMDAVPQDNTNLCYYLDGNVPNADSKVIHCTKPVIGRYLFIQLQYDKAILDFCEVKIHAFQFKDCPYNDFGPNCNQKCRCKNVTEKCDVIIGKCPASGCNDLYAGENCEIELPSMNRKPSKLNSTHTSITVSWPLWSDGLDNGQGLVMTYWLQYAENGTSSWTDAGNFSMDFQNTVFGLMAYTFYDFRVILGWQKNSTTSIIFGPAPESGAIGTFRTSCTEPTKGTNIVSHQGHIADITVWPSTISLNLQWEVILPENLNCESLQEYLVYYCREGCTDWLKNSTTDSKILLTSLVANAQYRLMVGVVNAEGFQTNGTITQIRTPEGRPGVVEDLSVIKLPNSELEIKWSKPEQAYGTIHAYYFQSQLVAYGKCQNTTEAGLLTWLTPSTYSYKMEWIDIHPYAKYKIEVFAETLGGNGTKAVEQEYTLPGVPLLKPVLSKKEVTSRSVKVMWEEYPCKERNGPNGTYNIHVFNLDTKDVNILDPIPLGDTLEKVIRGLIPYTRYLVVFEFSNSAGSSPNVSVEFVTHEEAPPPPTLEKLAVSPDSITIAWLPPVPPFGKISEFNLRYWKDGDYNDTSQLLTIPYGDAGTHKFSQLMTNIKYVFVIQARTSVGYGNWSEKLVVLTEEDWPGIPEKLYMAEKSTNSFKLTWQVPVRPAGVDLIRCRVSCHPVVSYDPNVAVNSGQHQEVFTSDQWITERMVTGLSQATQYNCSVEAEGNRGYGKAASKLFWTKPELAITDENFVKIKSHETTDHTITVHVPLADSFNAPISSFLIGVHDQINQRQKRAAVADSSTMNNLTDFNTAKQRGLHQYLAAELNKSYSGPFVIGDGKTYGKYWNPKLETGHKYEVLFGVVSLLDGEKEQKFARTSDPVTVVKYIAPTGTEVYIVVAVVLIIVIIILVLGAIFFMRHRRLKYMCKSDSLTDVKKMGPEEMTVLNGVSNPAVIVVPPAGETGTSWEDLITQTNLEDNDDQDLYENVSANHKQAKSHAILLDDIISYNVTMKKDVCDGFKTEYKEFKPELEHPHEISKKDENKGKNRFKNIVPYDHSRLILEVAENTSEIDYINANYIDGYKKKKAYIAAQGPTKAAIIDIWRAVWQERCPKIVMLTNFVEMGKPKCERYWPESGSKQYGDFTVELVEEEKFSDVTITSLKLSKDGQERRLKHFHFTVWPDHGAPKFASSMLHFWREVTGYSGEMFGPVYVHCSAGVGRTGTFIGLDYLIQQGSVEKMVNVFECVRQMRLARPKMVQTWEQYVFLHEALAEHFKVGLTAFPSSMFCDRYGSMVIPKKKGAQSRLQQQFKLLSLFSAEVQKENCSSGLSEENVHKNQSLDVIPEDRCRPYLTLPVEGYNSYINAVFVDGYSKRDAYIVSQMPLPHTVIDLWRLVYDHRVTSIVMLNQINNSKQDGIYWPSSKNKLDNNAFTVEMLSEDTSSPDVTTRDFKFVRKSKLQTNSQMLQRSVRQFQFNSWPEDKVIPSSADSIVSLLDSVERWQQHAGDGKILVHCTDGALKSGVFCVACSVIEKNKVEHDVDVFQFTRLTRMNRPQLVSSYEQYKFIHDIVSDYLQQFNIYANFK